MLSLPFRPCAVSENNATELLASLSDAEAALSEKQLQLAEAQQLLAGLPAWALQLPNNRLFDVANCTLLPGSESSRYLVPIDQPPARELRPRWGYTRPREELTAQWFSDNASDYLMFMQKMRVSASKLADIPLMLDKESSLKLCWLGVPHSPLDSLALYTMIVEHRPKIYVEIGSGITTLFAHRAIKDASIDTVIVSINSEYANIERVYDELIEDGLENCDQELFNLLRPGDVVLFNGSHRVFMNSDVVVFFVEILPRIPPGVIIGFRDVTLPFDYPENFNSLYWNEQYLLAVYLISNRDRLIPLFPTSYICKEESFLARLNEPFVDLGINNESWTSGRAIWFTHSSPR